jgi:hypothetical protein
VDRRVRIALAIIERMQKQQVGGRGGFAVPGCRSRSQAPAGDRILSLVGSIAANEMVETNPKPTASCRRSTFRRRRVDKGQLLVKLDESKLAAALAEGEANRKLSLANYDRAKQLLQDKLISQQEYDQAASTYAVNEASVDLKRRQLKDARIYAPFAGIVGRFISRPVIARTDLTWLVDLDCDWGQRAGVFSDGKIGQPLEFWSRRIQAKSSGRSLFHLRKSSRARAALVKALIANAKLTARRHVRRHGTHGAVGFGHRDSGGDREQR